MLRALLWDVDGTLAETEDAHRTAFNTAFVEAGLAWHWDRDLYGRLLTVSGGQERIAFYQNSVETEKPLSWDAIASLHKRKTAIYGELLASGRVSLRPGVARILHEAAVCGLKLAVTTTTSTANVHRLMSATLGHCAPRWAACVCAEDVTRKKPAPDVYTSALALLGLSARECLAVEDSQNGLRAALGAGIPCLVTPSAYTRDQDFSGAIQVMDNLESGSGVYVDTGCLWAMHAHRLSS